MHFVVYIRVRIFCFAKHSTVRRGLVRHAVAACCGEEEPEPEAEENGGGGGGGGGDGASPAVRPPDRRRPHDHLIAITALNFLADFTFASDAGAAAVLEQFPRLAGRFGGALDPETTPRREWERAALLEAAVVLCMNLAAMRPDGHQLLIPLIEPVCLAVLRSDRGEADVGGEAAAAVSDRLRGNAITFLANVSLDLS